MYRLIHPGDRQELSLRMLFHPAGEGAYLRACEADSYRGLVAALLNDVRYENGDVKTRLIQRLRLADDIVMLFQLEGRTILVSDRDDVNAIDISSDEPLIRSLDEFGIVSVEPSIAQRANDGQGTD
jgi:hypothetical protein